MSIKSLGGGVFGFEDATAEGAEEAIVVDADTNDAVAEIVEDNTAISDAAANIDETVNDTETLEKIEEVIAQAESSGEGLSEDAAAMANVAVEAIRIRMGGKGGLRALGAENFGQKADRLSSTRLALEGIGDTIKNAWAAVLKFIEKVWNAIKDFFVGIFDGAERMKKAAINMKKKVEKRMDTDGELKEGQKFFNDQGLASKLFIASTGNQSFATVKVAIKQVETTLVTVETATKAYEAALDGTLKIVVQINDKALTADLRDYQSLVKSSNDLYAAMTLVKVSGNELPGGIAVTVNKDKVTFTKGNGVASDKFEVLKDKEFDEICDMVKDLADKLIGMRKVAALIEKSSKQMGDHLSKISKIKEAHLTNGQPMINVATFKQDAKDARKAITKSASGMSKILSQFPSGCLVVGNAALKYVAKSAAQYGHRFEKSE